MVTLRKPGFLLVAALATLLTSCASGSADLSLNQHDVTALEQLYESGGWSFRESRVGVRVGDLGAVEVEVEGLASPRSEATSGAKSLWVPVVLLRELPPYYRAAEELAKSPVEIHAYKAKDGLWCLVAEVRMSQRTGGEGQPPASPTPAGTGEGEGATPVRVRMTMVSPQFESSLPLLVPTGPAGGSTDASVTLPNNLRFASLEFGGNEQLRSNPSKLTVLPQSLTGGANTAAAQLTPGTSAAWDFSRVAFHKQGWRAALTLNDADRLAPLIALIAGVSLLASEWRRWRLRRKFRARWKAAKAEASTIRRMAEREFGRGFLYNSAVALEKAFDAGRYLRAQTWEILLKIKLQIAEFRHALGAVRQELGRHTKEYERLDELEVRLERVEQIVQREDEPYPSDLRPRFEVRLFVLCLIVLAVGLLFSQLAWGQNGVMQAAPPPTPNPRAAELREFGMATKPARPDADDRDKVSVTLDFYPVVNVPVGEGEGPEDKDSVEINTDARAVIENFTHTEKVKLISKGRSQVVVEVPTKKERDEQLPNTNSGSVESVALLKPFDADKKDVMELKFDVRNVQSFNDRFGRWVHRFPWEDIEVNLPLRLNRSAQVYNVEAQKPSTDYVGDVQVRDVIDPFDPKTGQRAFVEDHNKYRFYVGDSRSRKVIRPDTRITLNAKFQRTGLQRFMLTWFLLLAGAVVGVGLGLAFRSTATQLAPLLVEALGLGGLYLALWGLIFTKFTSIPTIFLGQGITVSEIFFLIGCVLLLGVSYVVKRS